MFVPARSMPVRASVSPQLCGTSRWQKPDFRNVSRRPRGLLRSVVEPWAALSVPVGGLSGPSRDLCCCQVAVKPLVTGSETPFARDENITTFYYIASPRAVPKRRRLYCGLGRCLLDAW